MKKNGLKYCIYITGSALLVLLDRLSKSWAVSALKGQPAIEIWPGVFELHYLENYGMAFGLLQNQQFFFYVVTALILAVVLYLLYRTPMEKHYIPILVVLTFMTGGAIGNLIDRATTKYVVDFLYFKLINFPIFNVADIFVTVSAFALFILLLFFYKEDEFTSVYALKRKGAQAKLSADTEGQDTEGPDTEGQDTEGQDTEGQDTEGQDLEARDPELPDETDKPAGEEEA